MKVYTKEWYYQENKTTADLVCAQEKYHQLIKYSNISDTIQKDLHLHDAIVENFVLDDDTLIITFNTSHAASTVIEARFLRVQLQTNDGICEGDWWLYEEIYRQSDKYDLHILLCDAQSRAKELIFAFEEVLFCYNIEKQKKISKRLQTIRDN